jgi:hypothetical protein
MKIHAKTRKIPKILTEALSRAYRKPPMILKKPHVILKLLRKLSVTILENRPMTERESRNRSSDASFRTICRISKCPTSKQQLYIFFLLFNRAAKKLKLFAHVQKELKHTTYPIAPRPFKNTFVFISLAKTISVPVYTSIYKYKEVEAIYPGSSLFIFSPFLAV